MTSIDRVAFLASDPRVVDYVANVAAILGGAHGVVIVDDVTGAGNAAASRAELDARGLVRRDLSDVLRTGDRYRVVVGQGKTVLDLKDTRRLVAPRTLGAAEGWTVESVTGRRVLSWIVRVLVRGYARSFGRALERTGIADRLARTIGRRLSAREFTGPVPPIRSVHAPAERVIGDILVHFPHGVDVRALRPDERDGPQVWDLVLCHGPLDAADKARRWGLPTHLVGYPRYAHLDPAPVSGAPLGGGGRGPRRILWLPTAGNHRPGVDNAIELWLPAVSALAAEHRVTIRPHPKDVTRDATLADRLAKHGIEVDRDPARDVGALIAAADVVLCDYGGPIFSAVFLDRPVVLLDGYATGSPDDLDRVVRRDLLTLGRDEARPDLLRSTLEDEARWADQAEVRRRWRERLFGDAPQDGATAAAEALEGLRRDGRAWLMTAS